MKCCEFYEKLAKSNCSEFRYYDKTRNRDSEIGFLGSSRVESSCVMTLRAVAMGWADSPDYIEASLSIETGRVVLNKSNESIDPQGVDYAEDDGKGKFVISGRVR